MPADDQKHTEPIKLWLTERELLDLSRLAAREDRKVGEMARVALRRFMYGTMGGADAENNGANRPDEGRGG